MNLSVLNPIPDVSSAPLLSYRDGAILRAVGEGTAELLCGVEPDLFVGGRYCTDQAAARRLVRAGLIATGTPGGVGTRAPARLTAAGRTELAARSWQRPAVDADRG